MYYGNNILWMAVCAYGLATTYHAYHIRGFDTHPDGTLFLEYCTTVLHVPALIGITLVLITFFMGFTAVPPFFIVVFQLAAAAIVLSSEYFQDADDAFLNMLQCHVIAAVGSLLACCIFFHMSSTTLLLTKQRQCFYRILLELGVIERLGQLVDEPLSGEALVKVAYEDKRSQGSHQHVEPDDGVVTLVYGKEQN